MDFMSLWKEAKYTEIIKEGYDYWVVLKDPYTKLLRYGNEEEAMKARRGIEDAIDTREDRLLEGVDLDGTPLQSGKLSPRGKPKARPKLGVVKGGKE